MRQIVLDTETTGLSAAQGHRIIEIGCLEMINRRLTGRTFHYYLQPDRAVDVGAMNVHGITNEFLKGKPRFPDILEEFKVFMRDAELIIHNAPFDVGFLSSEFGRVNDPWEDFEEYFSIIDTLPLARQKHPGQKNNLDALCKRYNVDNQHRHKHGALLDSEILAKVYLRMTGGQEDLSFEEPNASPKQDLQVDVSKPVHTIEVPLIVATEEEMKAHQDFMKNVIKN
jgi:DNA polymerase-3 subunit epsilon